MDFTLSSYFKFHLPLKHTCKNMNLILLTALQDFQEEVIYELS